MEQVNVFDFVKSEEQEYKTNRIAVVEGWDWNMYEHCNLTALYKNSTYKTGKDDDKPFLNITRPLLNLQYRAEGFDVKDIVLFVDDPEQYFKSFLTKKYHQKWARENDIDTFIDDLVESYVDYGGVLVKNINQKKPEVVPLQRLAFCDQTDLLGGPICEKHYYSISQLQAMTKWDKQAIADLVALSAPYKDSNTQTGKENKTPGKYIEVYELHGTLPEWWIDGDQPKEEETESGIPFQEYVPQIQIIAYYKGDNDKDVGITLFAGKEKDSPYKFLARDKIYGRALGVGGAEELFEHQVWTNYDIIRIKGLLDAAAKVVYQTVDAAFANRNNISNVENGEIMVTTDPNGIRQINTQPVNLNLFSASIVQWEQHAQEMAGASDALMGKTPSSGTPFQLQQMVTQQGQELHTYRQGKLAIFLADIYRDWVMPYISREITNGQTFLSELDLDELQQVSDNLSVSVTNDIIKEKMLNGELIDPQEMDQLKQQVKQRFLQGSHKKFITILKGELKDAPLEVEVDIAGKQQDLEGVVDKLTNIFRTIMVNPAILQNPIMSKIFNQILESSGLEPLDYSGLPQPQQQQTLPQPPFQPPQPPQAQPQPASMMTTAAQQ